ncbi:ROK family transcriptional regulator [Streptomyces harbinensis]|uniref:Sugar kinase of the NBD/HSP70 family, may contain an N-terminal HTH domain n=1 Tax=Streptomyces harbinensis TaxID=1176198 RepID=A0A1I6VJA7_9ACTN|nr:ROK family transcriptional regulator [Streptomyces harbinensis]SFT13836.1 Sugar kinase of the NBD/HSP70 family, may contain an N-terminal HTH domain [Streptomyces harbinensis]
MSGAEGVPAQRSSRHIRTANRYRVLRRVLAAGPVSRPELAAATGLSQATVATVTGELHRLGMVRAAGFEDSAGGRPRALLAADPAGGTLIGVDVAETYVHAEVFDLTLRVRASTRLAPAPGEDGPARVVERIARAVGRLLADDGAPAGAPVLGVGVTMPGMVDREGGVSVFAANWDWREVPLLDLLTRRIPYRLYLDNPLRATTVAELWFGAARGRQDAVVVNLGTGVGAGLALGGAVHRGASNGAGEWGHTTLVHGGRVCRCGRRGCVESYVGAPGIIRTLTELAPDAAAARAGDQTAVIAALAAGCRAADPVALRVLEVWADQLGAAVADLVNLLDPEVVVLSSWVAREFGAALLTAVREAVDRYALGRPAARAEIVLSPVEGNPVSLGAATFALEGALA